MYEEIIRWNLTQIPQVPKLEPRKSTPDSEEDIIEGRVTDRREFERKLNGRLGI